MTVLNVDLSASVSVLGPLMALERLGLDCVWLTDASMVELGRLKAPIRCLSMRSNANVRDLTPLGAWGATLRWLRSGSPLPRRVSSKTAS